jgi:hypothetical protein
MCATLKWLWRTQKKVTKLKLLSKMFTDFSNYSTSQQGKDFSPFDNKVKVKINKKIGHLWTLRKNRNELTLIRRGAVSYLACPRVCVSVDPLVAGFQTG